MINQNPKVDDYLSEGCGRCSLGGTLDCKVHLWPNALALLRNIILETGLKEEVKWGVPCYTFNGKNILVLAAFKAYCSVSFFKGALLQDAENLLLKPTENIQASRMLKFTRVDEIQPIKTFILQYIYEAIEVEKVGLKVPSSKPEDLEMAKELKNKLDEFPALKKAFESLTSGRQKSYLLHISGAKQSKTREARVEKCIPKIMQGKGWNEY